MTNKDLQIEGRAEADEITELKELLEIRRILLVLENKWNFGGKAPKSDIFAGDVGYSELKVINNLAADAKKHNEAVATRAEKVFKDLIYYKNHMPMKNREYPLITKEEELIIRATLSLEPHLTVLVENFMQLPQLWINGQSNSRLRYSIWFKLRHQFEASRRLLNEIIAVVTKLDRLEEDVRKRLGRA